MMIFTDAVRPVYSNKAVMMMVAIVLMMIMM